jgi:integrase/recombinase XerD
MGDITTDIEWIEKNLEKFNEAAALLEHAIEDYLKWMSVNGYAQSTQANYKLTLLCFLAFIKPRRYLWNDVFTQDTLKLFSKIRGISCSHAINGLARYLFEKNEIAHTVLPPKSSQSLPKIYEDYLLHYKQNRTVTDIAVKRIRRVLCAFDDYCQRNGIQLRSLKIEHVDTFCEEFFKGFKSSSCGVYRSYLRRFLNYLFHECRVLTKNLASMVVGRREYADCKPPRFLRPAEVQRLFDNLNTATTSGVRTYAMVHIAYTMGLRPIEISHICLDDISFGRQLLRLNLRKGNNPCELPIPEHTIKAVAAYIIGARPKSQCRQLFLTLHPPHRPLSANSVGHHITQAMKRCGLDASAYWMRHTYAQNLLEAGASVYEIKEMLGHDKIESSKCYLRVHTTLMRKVLFDETL